MIDVTPTQPQEPAIGPVLQALSQQMMLCVYLPVFVSMCVSSMCMCMCSCVYFLGNAHPSSPEPVQVHSLKEKEKSKSHLRDEEIAKLQAYRHHKCARQLSHVKSAACVTARHDQWLCVLVIKPQPYFLLTFIIYYFIFVILRISRP